MTHPVEIDVGDPRGLADLQTYLARARRANPDGAVRLQVVGDLLVTTVAVLEGSGLLGEGMVLGMRVVRVAGPAPVDATVSFASLTDRLARRGDLAVLSVPPVTVRAAWAAVTPPRDGWEPVGRLAAADVDSIARQGIQEVASGAPEGAGAHAVEALRRRVWGRMSDTVPPIAGGLAFGAHVLGFLGQQDDAAVSTHGRWTRLSTGRGHVLVR